MFCCIVFITKEEDTACLHVCACTFLEEGWICLMEMLHTRTIVKKAIDNLTSLSLLFQSAVGAQMNTSHHCIFRLCMCMHAVCQECKKHYSEACSAISKPSYVYMIVLTNSRNKGSQYAYGGERNIEKVKYRSFLPDQNSRKCLVGCYYRL